jgi:hypothetical protein
VTQNIAKWPKRHDSTKFDTARKPVGARAPQRAGDGLTCTEAQVEDLLSEGEST